MTFCYRRLLIVLFIVYQSKSDFQVIGTMFVIKFAVIFQGVAMPFHKPSQRRIELFNEASSLMCCHFLFLFTDFVPDPTRRYEVGSVLIALFGFTMFVNLAFVYYDKPKRLYNKLRQLYLK
jgi:hypothetical protein